MRDYELMGKRVLIAGAAAGLGPACAEAFADAGAAVVLADFELKESQATAELIRGRGGDATALRIEGTSAQSVDKLLRLAVARLGGIDVLVNNAASNSGHDGERRGTNPDPSNSSALKAAIRRALLLTKAVAPHLRASGGGAVINLLSTSSDAPLWVRSITPKETIISITRAMARRHGADRITVNAIAPGLTSRQSTIAKAKSSRLTAARRKFRRVQNTRDMVGGVLFFASPQAFFVTGQTLVVDGGRQFL